MEKAPCRVTRFSLWIFFWACYRSILATSTLIILFFQI
jgi:hypothetical protein